VCLINKIYFKNVDVLRCIQEFNVTTHILAVCRWWSASVEW